MAKGALTLQDDQVSAVVRPSLGAGIARFDYIGRGERVPVFRPEPAGGARHGFELASQVLVPWSNRISSGGFTFRGKRYDLSPNIEGEPFPIHGNGFSQPWEVVTVGAASVALQLASSGPSPFRYLATLTYGLSNGALDMRLEVRNEGEETLPFGFGFHPWFVRTPATQLRAPATGVWLETEQHLPRGTAPVALPPEWNFGVASPLPDGFVNNAFTGWDRRALIRWPDRGLRLEIEASPPLSTYILYSPSAKSGFFCFEPASHPVDAFNLPGDPQSHGLTVLAPGETAVASAIFRVLGSV